MGQTCLTETGRAPRDHRGRETEPVRWSRTAECVKRLVVVGNHVWRGGRRDRAVVREVVRGVGVRVGVAQASSSGGRGSDHETGGHGGISITFFTRARARTSLLQQDRVSCFSRATLAVGQPPGKAAPAGLAARHSSPGWGTAGAAKGREGQGARRRQGCKLRCGWQGSLSASRLGRLGRRSNARPTPGHITSSQLGNLEL
jgi:hypothetical protein